MKDLNFHDLTKTQGGISCAKGWGIFTGALIGAAVTLAITGGTGAGVAYLMVANAGAALAVENCAK